MLRGRDDVLGFAPICRAFPITCQARSVPVVDRPACRIHDPGSQVVPVESAQHWRGCKVLPRGVSWQRTRQDPASKGTGTPLGGGWYCRTAGSPLRLSPSARAARRRRGRRGQYGVPDIPEFKDRLPMLRNPAHMHLEVKFRVRSNVVFLHATRLHAGTAGWD